MGILTHLKTKGGIMAAKKKPVTRQKKVIDLDETQSSVSMDGDDGWR
jgi:hypothetical protein